MAKLLIWILSVIAITKQNCEGTNRTPFIQRHYCVFLGRVNVRTREHLIVSVFILLSTYSKKKQSFFIDFLKLWSQILYTPTSCLSEARLLRTKWYTVVVRH